MRSTSHEVHTGIQFPTFPQQKLGFFVASEHNVHT